ncbi:hypothetical protein K3495_g7457 [Podosphaera aphanis]|nr:hypothetical protein K3495_g7457 [Podosphaera aphanis]
MTKRTLSGRQIRWKSLLDNLPGVKLRYRPGKDSSRPDALSRLEQDTPTDPDDPRLRYRDIQLIENDWIATTNYESSEQKDTTPEGNGTPFEDVDLARLWNQGVKTDAKSVSPKAQQADLLIKKLKEGHALAQSAMIWRKQVMEESANRGRQQSENFKEGDRVWLNLKNVETPRLSKKLAWLHNKYRVVKVISSHVVELDVPTGIHPRFNADLLKRAAEDPLPSQKLEEQRYIFVHSTENQKPSRGFKTHGNPQRRPKELDGAHSGLILRSNDTWQKMRMTPEVRKWLAKSVATGVGWKGFKKTYRPN